MAQQDLAPLREVIWRAIRAGNGHPRVIEREVRAAVSGDPTLLIGAWADLAVLAWSSHRLVNDTCPWARTLVGEVLRAWSSTGAWWREYEQVADGLIILIAQERRAWNRLRGPVSSPI